MATITASMVKALRERTGAGMMDCKAALTEMAGDMEAAIDWLRTKGLAKAAKKSGRVAAEGLIGLAETKGRAALVEINSETDFVARNEAFQDLVGKVAKLGLKCKGELAKLESAEFPGAGKSVSEHIRELVGTIGENMTLRRTAVQSVKNGVVASYMHNASAPGLGKIGVLVALESDGDPEALAAIGKQVAMHVAATSPLAVRVDELDPKVIEKERSVLREQARESGKPDNIIEKMIDGRMRKFYEEVVLLEQTFVVDADTTVGKAVKAAEATVGAPITVKSFTRFALGEGIDKGDGDFAAEVAAAASGG